MPQDSSALIPANPSNGGGKTRSEPAAERHKDPAYDLPLVGPLVRGFDQMRIRLPLGERANDGEAALLRAEARALRLTANYLDARAAQLDRLSKGKDEGKRIERVRLD